MLLQMSGLSNKLHLQLVSVSKADNHPLHTSKALCLHPPILSPSDVPVYVPSSCVSSTLTTSRHTFSGSHACSYLCRRDASAFNVRVCQQGKHMHLHLSKSDKV